MWGQGNHGPFSATGTVMCALVQRASELEDGSSWSVPPSQPLLIYVFTHSSSPSGLHADPGILGQNSLACANSQM